MENTGATQNSPDEVMGNSFKDEEDPLAKRLSRDALVKKFTKYSRILGLMLLFGFFFPMMTVYNGEFKFSYLNISILFSDFGGWLLKLLFTLPLIMGALVLIMSYIKKWGRSIVLIIVALSPLIILLANKGLRLLFLSMITQGMSMIMVPMFFIGILSWDLIFAGNLAGTFRPKKNAGPILAAIGAIFYFLTLVIPYSTIDLNKASAAYFASKPPTKLTIGLIAPFDYFSQKILIPIGIAILIAMALTITACVISLLNYRNNERRRIKSKTAFILIIFAVLTVFIGFIVGLVLATPNNPPMNVKSTGPIPFWTIFFFITTAAIKMGCWIGGMTLLLPYAVAELIVNPFSYE